MRFGDQADWASLDNPRQMRWQRAKEVPHLHLGLDVGLDEVWLLLD